MKTSVLVFGGNSDIGRALGGFFNYVKFVDTTSSDVREDIQVKAVMKYYRPKYVVNCAGVSYVGALRKVSESGYEEQARILDEIETNLLGSFNVARACIENNVRGMVFIASVAGLYGKAEHAGYCASKAGVISLVQSLGMEGYKAYAVSPGRVDTKMREHDYPGEDKRTRLTPIQVAAVIRDCLVGKYRPGSNVIIRKIGYRTFKRVDSGQPWKKYLNVQPIGTPKTI